MPGLHYRDGQVSFTAASFDEAYKGMQAIGIAESTRVWREWEMKEAARRR
jgi:hypothetical protein